MEFEGWANQEGGAKVGFRLSALVRVGPSNDVVSRAERQNGMDPPRLEYT